MTNFLLPADAAYDTERTGYNTSVEHKPEVIVAAESVADVVAAVRYAAVRGLAVAVLATGHGPSRSADGAVLVTTSRMRGVAIDPVARTARVEAGVRGGELVRAAAAHGLAPVNGSSPEVGVVSYHLGGGIGLLGRQLGWAVDHVRAIEVVTADGRCRRATADVEPELFWALRGGGKGTLGVVVALEIDLHPVARLYGGGMHFDAADAERVLTTWAEWTRTTPETMGTSVLLLRMPDLPFLPEAIRGRHLVHVRFVFTGDAATGERLVRRFRDLGPLTDTVAEMPYAQVGTIHAEPTTPVSFHGRTTMLRAFDAETVAALLEHVGPTGAAPYIVELRHMGGAFARPARVPSALGRRDGEFVLYAGGAAEGADVPALLAELDGLVDRMAPWSTGGVAVNFLSGPDVTAERLATGYRPVDVARLAAVKRAVDPADTFRVHHGRA